jgi:hypothetical protein
MPKQHVNATTTPEMRAFIRESDLPVAVLARLLKISEATVRKWKQRESLDDASHTPHTLNTTLSRSQEYVVVELRKRLLLSLDELLVVCREFVHPGVSRAGLQRCLKRYGVSRLGDIEEGGQLSDADQTAVRVAIENKAERKAMMPEVSPEAMKNVLGVDEKEIVHVKVTELPDFDGESRKRRLLIANDPDSDWVYVDVYEGDEMQAAERYMSHVLNNAPFHIRKILAGNYNEFLSRFRVLGESDEQPADSTES